MNDRLRKTGSLLGSILLALLICACAGAEERFESNDFAASLTLSGRGLTSTVNLSFENRGSKSVTVLIRDIALNSECTGYSAKCTVSPGQSGHTASFRRDRISPVTVCDAGIAVLDGAGNVLHELTLTVFPYGESAARRPALADFPNAVVALDSEDASLLIMSSSDGSDGRRILWLYNKSGSLMRLQADRILADGKLTDLSLTMQALPRTGQYAELDLPVPLPQTLSFSLSGYTTDHGDQAVFRQTYDYRPAAPVSVPTMVPVNTPTPQIGTVTIRKSGPVNVRDGDHTGAKKIGSAKAGKTYPCFGVSPAGWYLIRLEDGTEGYVTNTLTTFQRQ